MSDAPIPAGHGLLPPSRPELLSEQNFKSLVSNIAFVYRHYFGVLFLCQLLPMLPFALLLAFISHTAEAWRFITALLLLISSFVAAGAMTVMVADICRGTRPGVRRSYARMFKKKRLWHILGALLLVTLGVMLGTLLLLVPGVWFAVRASLCVIIVMIEGSSSTKAVRRSFTLTKGQVWRISGLLLIAYLLMYVVLIVGNVCAVLLLATVHLSLDFLSLINLIWNCASAPIFTLTLVLLYYDQRVRRESYDAQALTEDLMR